MATSTILTDAAQISALAGKLAVEKTGSATRSPREAFLVSRILKDLREKGHFAFKTHGSIYMIVGLPDVIACVHGYFVAMEIKRDASCHASEAQKENLKKVSAASGFARTIHSWEGYEKFMKDIEKEAFGD